jgi:glycosyltransferase involved in cell wall biosynthesis
VAPERVPGFLAKMNVAAAPYPDLDQFYFSPLKLLEYMAAGVPVVASNVGQISELIDDGVDGLLCKPGDANALTLALLDILHAPARAERLARAAREKVEGYYSWDSVVARMLELANVNTLVGA